MINGRNVEWCGRDLFRRIARNLRIMTEEIHQTPQSGPRCESEMSRLRSRMTPTRSQNSVLTTYWNQSFITMLTKAGCWSLFRVGRIHAHRRSILRSIIIVCSFHICVSLRTELIRSDMPISILCKRSLITTLKAYVQILCVLPTVLKYTNQCHSAKPWDWLFAC
jgi:hypothetical protein